MGGASNQYRRPSEPSTHTTPLRRAVESITARDVAVCSAACSAIGRVVAAPDICCRCEYEDFMKTRIERKNAKNAETKILGVRVS